MRLSTFRFANPVVSALFALSSYWMLLGCQSGGVGDPCIPEDEYQPDFSGFAVKEANVESRSVQCETRVCLANHFQGRVSCPYGQDDDPATAGVPNMGSCKIPGSDDAVTIAVKPQLVKRRANDSVYCSCRCDGPDKGARYCECPSGYACEELLQDIGLGKGQLAGSYCIKEGTRYEGLGSGAGANCDASKKDCEDEEG